MSASTMSYDAGPLAGETGTIPSTIPLPAPGFLDAAAVYWHGHLNVCYTDGGVGIRTVQLNADLSRGGNVNFYLPPGNVINRPGEYGMDAWIVPVVTPTNASGEPDLLVFVPAQLASLPTTVVNTIFYASLQEGKVKQLGGDATPIRFGQQDGQRCCCTLAGSGFGLTVASYNLYTQNITIYFFPWDKLDSLEAATKLEFAATADCTMLTSLYGNYVMTSGVSSSGEQNQAFVMAGIEGSTENNTTFLVTMEMPLSIVDGKPRVDPSAVRWTKERYNSALSSLALSKSPDGRLFLYLARPLDQNWGFSSCFWEAPGQWTPDATPFPAMPITISNGSLTFVPGYIPGALTEAPSRVNPDLSDAEQPLARILLVGAYGYTDLGGSGYTQFSYAMQTYGSVRRKALMRVKPEKQLLLGIIEGPPPLPIENINLEKEWDLNGANVATAAVSTAVDRTTSISVDFSCQLAAKVKAEIEGAASEFEAKAGYGLVYESAKKITSNANYAVALALETIEKGGTSSLAPQPNGVAFFFGADATGFIYQFIDPSGKTPEDSPEFVQIFALDPHITVLPYVMNPGQAPYPGQLLSYVLDQDERDALKQLSVIEFDSGSGKQPYISTAWAAGGGKLTQSFESYDSTKFVHKLLASASALVGPRADALCLGKGQALFGLQVNLSVGWGSEQGKRAGLATDIGTLGNIHAPNSYTSFSFDTYQLKENPTWAADLKAALLQQDATGKIVWPVDPHERKINQDVLEAIGECSAPWKITYALDAYQFNQSLREVLDMQKLGAGTLVDDLEREGITTTGALAALIEQRSQPGPQGSAMASLHERITSDVQLKEKIGRAIKDAQNGIFNEWRSRNPPGAKRFGAR